MYIHACIIQTVLFCIMTGPPTNVIVEAKSCNSASVTRMGPEPRVCDGVISGYNVRYCIGEWQWYNGEHTTVNNSTTSVMLQGLALNAEYSVEVAVTTSVGTLGLYSSESALYHRYCNMVTQEVVKDTEVAKC